MKFAVVAVVVCTLAIAAQASVVPLVLSSPALSYTAVHGPAITIAHSLPASVAIHATPVAVHAAPVVVPAPVLVAAQGTYVAKTRGAVHIAPLPGHLNSAASVNLEPAPGTV